MSASPQFRESPDEPSVSDRVSDTVQQAKSKISDIGSAASEKIDQNRAAAADGMEEAAETIHRRADQLPVGRTVSNLAHSTADTMSATADYVREHDVSAMIDDVERMVKRNPGPSLLCAAALGFLVGRVFSGRG